MAGYYKKMHKIRCVDCGKPRMVNAPNYEIVKRCKSCQYDQKRRYNSAYVRKMRAEQKKAKKTK